MNIFAVDNDPVVAAKSLCDRHVVKMTLETAQILCTVARKLGHSNVPYKSTHANHPSVVWVSKTYENWKWAVEHGLALADEYQHRYGKEHASRKVIQFIKDNQFAPTNAFALQPFSQNMPDQYKCSDAVEAYRKYYIYEKHTFAKWAKTQPPSWWPYGK